eukprot:5000554-Pleurochrysis_carterae.AAC.3
MSYGAVESAPPAATSAPCGDSTMPGAKLTPRPPFRGGCISPGASSRWRDSAASCSSFPSPSTHTRAAWYAVEL